MSFDKKVAELDRHLYLRIGYKNILVKKATKPPSALGVPRPSTEWLLILPPDLSSNASDALRAARADDRLYDPLCLNRLERVINA